MGQKRHSSSKGRTTGRAKALVAVLCFALLTVCLPGFPAAAEGAKPAKLHLNIVVSNDLTHGENPGELAAAADYWIRTVGASQNLEVDTTTEVSASSDLIRSRIAAGTVDILASSTTRFLEVDRNGQMEPEETFSVADDKGGKVQYLILTKQDAGLGTVESLKDKVVLTYSRNDKRMSEMWTAVLLHEHHLPRPAAFFRSITPALKPSTACLPVFFGKADACIVDSATWKVLNQLNGQLGAKLRPIAQSPDLLESVVAVHVNRVQFRGQILNGLNTLESNPGGRQVLLFFKARHVYKITRDDLSTVVRLKKQYDQIMPPEESKAAYSPAAGRGGGTDRQGTP